MCGIFCTILYNRNTFLNEIIKNGDLKKTNSHFAEFWEAFTNRGPDKYQEVLVNITLHTVAQFAGSVLWTQGSRPTAQPLIEKNNVLLWNGDIFFGPLADENNDTINLWNKLKEGRETGGASILQIISSIRGPFSFIYYEEKTRKLYFGRDCIGRHSLLIGFTQRSIVISSVANRNSVSGFMEVPAVGIFVFSLEKDGETPLTLHPWSHLEADKAEEDAIRLLPKTAVDSLKIGDFVQSHLQPPRRHGRSKLPSLSDLSMWNVQHQEYSLSGLLQKITLSDAKTRMKQTMESLAKKSSVQILVGDLLKTLKQAVRVRVEKQPKFCKNCVKSLLNGSDDDPNVTRACSHAKVALLFSGGLDSAVLASLAHGFVPNGEPIDLLNVAFEKSQQKTKNNRSCKKELNRDGSYAVPDRITGLSTLSELKALHPDRTWNFVEINVSLEELEKERKNVITHLIYPLNTVLDDSLGCALWFASRGRGTLNGENEVYTSPARILFSGMGADEQLGGYMRHRTTLKHRGGWEALDDELQYELKRISLRNLGRDDRIASDHGRQLRMPYLDEDVINYLSFLPPWNRCYPVDSMPPGVGDKLLLRLAAWDLGLRNAANLPKKAMQFGSRIANSREKADDASVRLNA